MTFSGRYRYFETYRPIPISITDILTTKFCPYFSINLTLKASLISLQRKTIANTSHQRWSPRGRPWPRERPRGQILKSLASKVKSLALASRPQVLENWPVLGSRTALFFELLKFCGALEKFFGKRFFVEIA